MFAVHPLVPLLVLRCQRILRKQETASGMTEQIRSINVWFAEIYEAELASGAETARKPKKRTY
jgi:hypothetical protein